MTCEMLFSTRKRPIGCKRDAERAAAGELRYVDQGLFKRVYRDDACKVVYKLARGATRGDPSVSEGRAVTIIADVAWAALGVQQNVPGIPHVSLYMVDGLPVLAMMFVRYDSTEYRYSVSDKRRDKIRDRIYECESAWADLGLEDMHSYNFRLDGNYRPVAVDFGGWGYHYPSDALPEHVSDIRTDVYGIAGFDEDDGGDTCDNCGEFSVDCCCDSCDRHGHERCDDCGYCVRCEDYEHNEACNAEHSPSAHCNHKAVSCAGAQAHGGAGLTTRMRFHKVINSRVTCGMRPHPSDLTNTRRVPVARRDNQMSLHFRIPTCPTDRPHYSHKGLCSWDGVALGCRHCAPKRAREARAEAQRMLHDEPI